MSPSGHYSFIHATHPGRSPERQTGDAHDHIVDTPEEIKACLNCPVPDKCRPKSRVCPLSETEKKQRGKEREEEDLEKSALKMIRSGSTGRKIRSALHIDYRKLEAVKKRLRERGEIE